MTPAAAAVGVYESTSYCRNLVHPPPSSVCKQYTWKVDPVSPGSIHTSPSAGDVGYAMTIALHQRPASDELVP
eukprot:525112-Rhodomonas_salina.3